MGFNKLNITEDVLDKLGFTEYWDENGTSGGRTLHFETSNDRLRVNEQCQMDDCYEGYNPKGAEYVSQHWSFLGWFATPKVDDDYDLFFLHEIYEVIKKHYPKSLNEFVERCEKVLMGGFIKSYIDATAT
jgi:hypothetical protein